MFWLVALGALILGRWPTALPKAWATGKAEPWPTQQQVREQRDAARGRQQPATSPAASGAHAPKPPTAPRPEPATTQAHASSKKRKRKRRT